MLITLRKLQVLTEPNRFGIAKLLLESKHSTYYIQEIAAMLVLDRRLVTFHLRRLEECNIVESELKAIEQPEPNKKGKAARFFKLTKNGEKLMKKLLAFIKELEESNRKGENIE